MNRETYTQTIIDAVRKSFGNDAKYFTLTVNDILVEDRDQFSILLEIKPDSKMFERDGFSVKDEIALFDVSTYMDGSVEVDTTNEGDMTDVSKVNWYRLLFWNKLVEED